MKFSSYLSSFELTGVLCEVLSSSFFFFELTGVLCEVLRSSYSLGCSVTLFLSLLAVSLLTGVLSEVLPLLVGCYSLGCSAR